MLVLLKEIPGYEGRYFANNLGQIFNNRGKQLSPFINNNGYLRVNLCINGKETKPLIHRLVALTFCENPNQV